MGNIILNGITPAAGKIKLGTQDISRIYAGDTLVWGGSFNENLGYDAFTTTSCIKILPSGEFYTSSGPVGPYMSNGIAYNLVAKYSPNGILDRNFAANTLNTPITFNFINSRDSQLVIHPDGQSALICGKGNSGYEGYKLLKINSDGTFDMTFNDNAKFPPTDDSKIAYSVIAIGTDIYAHVGGFGLIKFDQYGVQDTSFPSLIPEGGAINSMVTLLDGSILLAGSFDSINTLTNTSHLVKILPNGTVDTVFASNWGNLITGSAGSDAILSVAVGLDGGIFIGGFFTSVPITLPDTSLIYRNYILKLNSDGTVNSDFSFNMGNLNSTDSSLGGVRQIKINPDLAGGDYKVLLAGDFYRFYHQGAYIFSNHMTKLTSNGFADNNFYFNTLTPSNAIGFDSETYGLDIQDNGKIIAVGTFSKLHGVDRPRIARLTSDGYAD